ncbi:hypothetical protein C0992_003659, partial [Termitomyces sp. T32_za158]
ALLWKKPPRSAEPDSIGEAMELPYILPIEVGGAHGRAGGVGGDEMSMLTTQVHHHYDSIVAMGVWEFHDEVDGCYAPAHHGSQKRVQLSHQEMMLELGPKAQIAGAVVGTNVLQHLGPSVVTGHQFQHFPVIGVSSNVGVMVLLEDVSPELWVI